MLFTPTEGFATRNCFDGRLIRLSSSFQSFKLQIAEEILIHWWHKKKHKIFLIYKRFNVYWKKI